MHDYLYGVWIYRSLINNPKPLDLRTERLRETIDSFIFGQGELVFYKNFNGQLAGELSLYGDEESKTILTKFHLVGSTEEGSPGVIRLQGKGKVKDANGVEEEWVYDYLGYPVPSWPNGSKQRSSIVGSVIRTVPHSGGKARAGAVASFVAVKQDFPEPRNVIPLEKSVIDVLGSKLHRLHHASWHSVRDEWEKLSTASQNKIEDLNWKPNQPSLDKKDRPLTNNNSGEDFLFMHRQMILMVRDIRAKEGKTDSLSWPALPSPRQANHRSGFAVPAFEPYTSNDASNRATANIKSDDYFSNRFRIWEEKFKDPSYLSTLTLGQLGSLLEWSIHNSMHMRWATTPRDPETGVVLNDETSRKRAEAGGKWDKPEYDWLGEIYSSHVNPIFWRLHSWVDDRVEDWWNAHEVACAEEVVREDVEGVPWFKPGKWVTQKTPWVGPRPTGGHQHGNHGDPFDAEKNMESVLKIIQDEVDSRDQTVFSLGVERKPGNSVGFATKFKIDLT